VKHVGLRAYMDLWKQTFPNSLHSTSLNQLYPINKFSSRVACIVLTWH